MNIYEYIWSRRPRFRDTLFLSQRCCSTHIVERNRMHISELQVEGEGTARKQGKEKYPKNVFKESPSL